eukprot:TRINITY_DN14448_c0_g1_i2.p1 TRINITY_DN14448_c0_g1~~TRINITY_DN14448_c0_g1_i2.p1  ORF type:complete len:284 (+),score=56.38 TRINITY_DN14448_c0_g1_i2:63-854(+)
MATAVTAAGAPELLRCRMATAGACGQEAGAWRQPLKARGRLQASDELRARCLARVREGRAQLFERLRRLPEDSSCQGQAAGYSSAACDPANLRILAREVIMQEAGEAGARHDFEEYEPYFEYDDRDIDALIELEEALMREMETAERDRAIDEAEALAALQEAEDLALYEQHLLGGVICPLCGEGRLHRHETGELRCTQCADMRATTMDEALPLEDVLELMGAAEQQHWQSGCSARACFKVKHDYGPPMLFLCCDTCAWNQIAL